jgi:hypothetical protein
MVQDNFMQFVYGKAFKIIYFYTDTFLIALVFIQITTIENFFLDIGQAHENDRLTGC